MKLDSMKTVYVAAHGIGADIVLDFLEQNGIKGYQVGNVTSSIGDLGSVEIRVKEEDVAVAEELLKDFSL